MLQSEGDRLEAWIREAADFGAHPYIMAVFKREQSKVFIDACPEIIIEGGREEPEAGERLRLGRAPEQKIERSELAKLLPGLSKLVSALPELGTGIVVEEPGNFSYTRATLHARRKDKISWLCEQGEFAIHFRARTPFEKVLLQSEKRWIRGVEIVPQAAPGAYPYVVAVFDAKRDKVFIDACAEIVVDS